MREVVALECSVCKSRNYMTNREMRRGEKLSLKKFCKKCQGRAVHNEKKKK